MGVGVLVGKGEIVRKMGLSFGIRTYCVCGVGAESVSGTTRQIRGRGFTTPEGGRNASLR